MPVEDTKTQVNDELKVGGMNIRFEDGTYELEVKTVLENYNMTTNYSIDCNTGSVGNKYYIIKGWKKRIKIGLYLLLLLASEFRIGS
uniref:hypothetical protein n=1 Tax=Methanosarcina siciliae TaxID=38027 RepID=UPI001E523F33|nr:hypothetical protein [Methanosarcina siciliae]